MLATIYIPLTFVAGVFGMNVAQLNLSNHDVSIWEYWLVAVPVTIVSVVAVIYWDLLTTRLWKIWTWPQPKPIQQFFSPRAEGFYASARTIARYGQKSRVLRRQQIAEAVGLPSGVERGTSTIVLAGMGMGLGATASQYTDRQHRDEYISQAYYDFRQAQEDGENSPVEREIPPAHDQIETYLEGITPSEKAITSRNDDWAGQIRPPHKRNTSDATTATFSRSRRRLGDIFGDLRKAKQRKRDQNVLV